MHILCLPGGAHELRAKGRAQAGTAGPELCVRCPECLCLLFVARRLAMLQAAAARPPLQSVGEVGAVCGTRPSASQLLTCVWMAGMPVFLTEGWALGAGRHSAQTCCLHVWKVVLFWPVAKIEMCSVSGASLWVV